MSVTKAMITKMHTTSLVLFITFLVNTYLTYSMFHYHLRQVPSKGIQGNLQTALKWLGGLATAKNITMRHFIHCIISLSERH